MKAIEGAGKQVALQFDRDAVKSNEKAPRLTWPGESGDSVSMLPFITEFPILRSSNKAAFPAEVFAWLRGMAGSTVLNSTSEREFDGENVHFITSTGEELRMRELVSDGEWKAIGFRHDMPDEQGRVWRTEAVLRRGGDDILHDLIRIRTQCLAKQAGAIVQTPKKPFLIKSLLSGEWGGVDGELCVCDKPFWLGENEEDLDLAKLVLHGKASEFLPIVYISATGDERWLFNKSEIEKLAYDLGGVVHVVVEPSRNFSFQLRDQSSGKNVYGGTVGLALPQGGFVRRFFLSQRFESARDILEGIRGDAIRFRAHMPSIGWDWTDFQEYALRRQRETLRSSLSQVDADQLFEEFTKQLDDLQEENKQLKDQMASQIRIDAAEDQGGAANDRPLKSVGKEIYPGEVLDRIRFAAETALLFAEAEGIDERSRAIWRKIVDCVPRSSALDELLSDLVRATKDAKRMASEIGELLQRHGYRDKSDKNHICFEPQNEFVGLRSITISKTPSDRRGLVNARKQIERTLGIGKLPSNIPNGR